jgi:hypothetical protein
MPVAVVALMPAALSCHTSSRGADPSQDHVHEQRDTADADDADVNDIQQEVGRGVHPGRNWSCYLGRSYYK